MRATIIMGWIIAPFVMLPASWNKLSPANKTLGAVWTSTMILMLIFVLLSTPQGNPAQKVQTKVIPAAASPNPEAMTAKGRP
ncbi:hypothetical protein SAMN05444162_4161 [Paenibacillaceae bacterium GAS479]|nr:hypothetical protein SAMN05444162_4161 [Paenibacillaceae bacterium GAS479]